MFPKRKNKGSQSNLYSITWGSEYSHKRDRFKPLFCCSPAQANAWSTGPHSLGLAFLDLLYSGCSIINQTWTYGTHLPATQMPKWSDWVSPSAPNGTGHPGSVKNLSHNKRLVEVFGPFPRRASSSDGLAFPNESSFNQSPGPALVIWLKWEFWVMDGRASFSTAGM